MEFAFLKLALAVLDYSGELREGYEFKGLHQKLLFPRTSTAGIASSSGEGFLPMQTLSDEVCRTFGAGAVCRSEDDSITEIEESDLSFLFTGERRNEGDFGLCRHHRSGSRLPDQIHVPIRFGNEPLRFVLPTDEQIVVCQRAFPGCSGIKSAKRMRVEKKFENGCDVASLRLIFLRHGHAKNGAIVQGGEVEAILFRTKYFNNVWVGEVIQIVVDCRDNAAELLWRLTQVAVEKVLVAFPGVGVTGILQRLQPLKHGFEHWLVLQHLEHMVHGGSQFEQPEKLNRPTDIRVCLRFEKSFIFAAASQSRSRVHDNRCIGRPRDS